MKVLPDFYNVITDKVPSTFRPLVTQGLAYRNDLCKILICIHLLSSANPIFKLRMSSTIR